MCNPVNKRPLESNPRLIRYRVVVGGRGVVFDGCSISGANRQFKLIMARFYTEGSMYFGKPITLLKDGEMIREYYPPDA